MSTIREFIKAAQQMEDFQKQAVQSFATMDRLSQPMSGIARLSDSIAELRQRMLVLGQAAEAMKPISTSLAFPAFEASRSIASMLDASRTPLKLVELMSVASRDWQKSVANLEAVKALSFSPVEMHFAKLYELSKIADFSLRDLKLEDIGGRLRLGPDARSALADVHFKLGSEYRTFYESVTASETALVSLPKPLTELPAVEYLNQTALISSTSEVELDEDVKEANGEVRREYATEAADQLTGLLRELDPDLPLMLVGARVVLESKHADYVRHFAASLRELFTQVLHHLAPDDAVRVWTTTPADFHNGRPTRKARLRYVTRDVPLLFGGFVNADVDAVVEFVNLFQKGTHAPRPDFTPDEVNDLKVRMEGLLRILLVVNTLR